MTDPNLHPDRLSADVSRSPRPCPRDGEPMLWLGEMIHCPKCNLLILTNQAAVTFNMIQTGQYFVTPPKPDTVWKKTSYDLNGAMNAVMVKDPSMVASFSGEDIMVLAINRLMAGIFSWN